MATQVKTDRAEARRSRRRAARRTAVKYASIYAVVSIAWIVLSDRILVSLGLPQDVEDFLASVKGVGFVLVTAALLLVLTFRYFKSLEVTQERYTRLFENAVEGLTLFKVVRDQEGELVDLEVVDMNPTQQARTGLSREEAVGRRLSRPDGLDERTRSYLEVVASAAGSGGPARSELHVRGRRRLRAARGVPRGPRPLGALRAGHQRRAPRGEGPSAAGGDDPPRLRRRARRGDRRQADPAHRRGARRAARRAAHRPHRVPDAARPLPGARRRRPHGGRGVPGLGASDGHPHPGGRGARQRPAPRRRRHLPAVRPRRGAAGRRPRRGPGYRLPHAAPGHPATGVLDRLEPGDGVHDHAAGLRAGAAEHAPRADDRGPRVRPPPPPGSRDEAIDELDAQVS